MITIHLKLFASMKDACGFSEKDISYERPVNVSTLIQDLADLHPAVLPGKDILLVAVNEEYAAPETILRDGDTVAVFPPVSGG